MKETSIRIAESILATIGKWQLGTFTMGKEGLVKKLAEHINHLPIELPVPTKSDIELAELLQELDYDSCSGGYEGHIVDDEEAVLAVMAFRKRIEAEAKEKLMEQLKSG